MKAAATTRSAGTRFARALTVGVATLMGFAMVGVLPVAPVPSASAAEALTVYARFNDAANYKGVAVTAQSAGPIAGVAEVRVTLHRSSGGDVVKTSKATGSVPTAVSAGNATTAPMIIVQGTYDEAGSGSWNAPSPTPVWNVTTVPTSVSVEYLDASGVVLAETLNAPIVNPNSVDIDAVLAGVPQLWKVDPYFTDSSSYKGVGVNFSVYSITDATEVIVQVDRSSGGPVVKTSQPGASFLSTINSAGPGVNVTTTAPIVIQAGTYNEAGSSSWVMPTATWTADTTPVSATVTIVRSGGPDLVLTAPIGNPLNADVSSILPAAAPGLAETGSDDAHTLIGVAGILVVLGIALVLPAARLRRRAVN